MNSSKAMSRGLCAFLFVAVAVACFVLGFCAYPLVYGPHVTYVEVTPDQQAKATLIQFLDALHQKNYDAAIAYYGGDYDQLRDWNPTVEPENYPMLWKNGCEMNGLNCLEVRNLTLESQSDDTFNFIVWFTNADGVTEFSVQPMGAPEAQNEFMFTVTRDGDQYRVETVPVYTP